MKKRIRGSILFVTFLTIVLLTCFLTWQFYRSYADQVRDELKNQALVLQSGLEYEGMDMDYVESLRLDASGLRVTLVGEDGGVRYDNTTDASGMDNHLSRPEVRDAREKGVGRSQRYSRTIGKETYYYAVRLGDGTVLRVAKTADGVNGVLFKSIPLILLVVILVLLIGSRISKSLVEHIIKPINEVDLESEDVTPVYDELSPFLRKISHQSEQIGAQELALENKAHTMDAIIRNMKEGLIFIGHKGNVLYINNSALVLFGASETEGFEGKNITELTRDVEMLRHVHTALEGRGVDVMVDLDGKTYNGIFSPVEDEGALILFLDVTEKVKAEKLRREFTANVSHELKTPLTTISGYAEMMSNGMVKEGDVGNFAGKIKDESSRLLTLIEDIIMLSNLDESSRSDGTAEADGKGAGVGEDQVVDVLALATETIHDLDVSARANQVTVTALGEACEVAAKGSLAYELLYNLIDNGIKYNKPGGTLDVYVSGTPDGVRIRVSDTGIGIPKEHLDRVFERFYRVDKSRSKKTGGTGLGLSIVKHAAQVMGGTVRIESEEGVGTTVTVTLPARR